MRKSLSDVGVAALRPRAKRYAHPDPELAGHYVRVTPGGVKSFVVVTRDPAGRQVWATIGPTDLMPIAEARDKGREAMKRVQAGKPAFEEVVQLETFESVAKNWLDRYVKTKGLRSEAEITRLLEAHVYPEWKRRLFAEIRRSDVTKLLDEVEKDHGARQADYVLAIVRGIMHWHAARADDYMPPIVKGMRRSNPKESARERRLSDDELRAVWTVAENDGAFGALVRLLLLTGQRREKVATMRWQDITDDGVWEIPAAAREKGNAKDLKLSKTALEIICAQPHIGKNPYVFAATRKGRRAEHATISNWGKRKRAFDAKVEKILPNVPQWQLHDLRRTARSMMSRAGVQSEHAERVLGHVQPGVAGIYDRHEYFNEKGEALAKLEALIGVVVRPQQTAKVVTLRRRGKQ